MEPVGQDDRLDRVISGKSAFPFIIFLGTALQRLIDIIILSCIYPLGKLSLLSFVQGVEGPEIINIEIIKTNFLFSKISSFSQRQIYKGEFIVWCEKTYMMELSPGDCGALNSGTYFMLDSFESSQRRLSVYLAVEDNSISCKVFFI